MKFRDNKFLKYLLIGGIISMMIAFIGLEINSNILSLTSFSIGLILLICFWIDMTQFLYRTTIEDSIWFLSLIVPIVSVIIYIMKYISNEEYIYYTSEEKNKILTKRYGEGLKGIGNAWKENVLFGAFANKKKQNPR